MFIGILAINCDDDYFKGIMTNFLLINFFYT